MKLFKNFKKSKKVKMSKVGLLYEPFLAMHEHSTEEHVERPDRIRSIYSFLLMNGLVNRCVAIRGREIRMEELNNVHDEKYFLELYNKLSMEKHDQGVVRLGDGDMYSNRYTLECCLLAAGSTVELVRAVAFDRINHGFAIVRPPGHHAHCGEWSGFCYINNVMVATGSVLNSLPKFKIWIVDFDVHVGDGTIDLIKRNSDRWGADRLRYYSIHRHDNGRFYPGGTVGATTKTIDGQIVLNGFCYGGKGDDFYLNEFRNTVTQIGTNFKPDMIIVSAGFDAAKGDPLGGCNVTPKGYYEMVRILKSLSPRVAMVLEGGYNLDAISRSAGACVEALLKR
jgi:histone deacetylase 6